MILKRRRFKQTVPLKEMLAAWANGVREKANKLPPGPERDGLLKNADQAQTASRIGDWANSLGSQLPR